MAISNTLAVSSKGAKDWDLRICLSSEVHSEEIRLDSADLEVRTKKHLIGVQKFILDFSWLHISVLIVFK